MQNEKVIKKLKVKDFTIPISFITISLILLAWFNFTSSGFDRIIAVGIFIMFVLPIYIKIYAFKISGNLKMIPRYEVDGKGIITKVNKRSNPNLAKNGNKAKSNNSYKKDYKTKEITNDNYVDLRNCIIASSKNKLLRRADILEIKATINTLLGSHQFIYADFNFENDLQEIYTKIKSSKMDDDKWAKLLKLMNNINGKGLCRDEDYKI